MNIYSTYIHTVVALVSFCISVEPVSNLNTEGVIRTYVGKQRDAVDVLVDSNVDIVQAVSCLGNFVEFVVADVIPPQLNADVTDAFSLMFNAAWSRVE